jgi:3-methylcrotonyl-CoA carboxylase alpha subunit
MDAVVVAVSVVAGQIVKKGEPLVVLEAMKMEVNIFAPRNGIVDSIHVAAADTIKTGARLLLIKAAS